MLAAGLRTAGRSATERTSSAIRGAALPQAPIQQQIRQQWTDRRGYQHFEQRGRFISGGYTRRSYLVLGVAGAGGLVVWVGSLQEVPYTGRRHSVLLSLGAERHLGRETYQQVLAEARHNGTLLPPHHPAVQAVKRVGTRIARVAGDGYGGGFQEHMQGLDWEFAVIRSDQANAFVVPGGKVVVYTGLLEMLRSQDELAAVLAHECAHVVARHGAERLSQAQFLEVGRLLMYWVLGLAIPSGILTAAFFLPNSRKAETEADIIGIQMAARACYDPSAAVVVFEKLEQLEKALGADAMPRFLRTHPVNSERIQKIKQMLPKAETLYDASGCEAAFKPLHTLKRVVAGQDRWG